MLWAASEVLAAGYPPEASFCKCPSYAHRLFPRKAVEKVYFTGRKSNVVVSLLEKPSQVPSHVGYLSLEVLRGLVSCSPWARLLAGTVSWHLTCQARAHLKEEELSVDTM